MAVKIGSARIDEKGGAHGGAAGDQTGKEVSTQNWYKSGKGWRVLRCVDAAKAAKMAKAMQAACDNPHIGYDQYQRDTLYKAAKGVGFDPGKVTANVETDCSALVRVCMAYAGIMVGSFRTTTQASVMLATGMFVELTGGKYTDKSDYLRKGDVLVTRTQGHTVIVLSDGPKAEKDVPASQAWELGERILKNGMTGQDVKAMQTNLILLGYDCGRWGADGDFGDATEMAVKAFQRAAKVDVDGEFGPVSLAAMEKALEAIGQGEPRYVQIVGGNCYVRSAPNTGAMILDVAHAGDKLEYQGETSENGWLLVAFAAGGSAVPTNGWVSGKYGRLEE